jgi:hypothetical protein
MQPENIVVPETGKAVFLAQNWTGVGAVVSFAPQKFDVPPKQGETPGRMFVPLQPGRHIVLHLAINGKGVDWAIDVDPGEIFVLPVGFLAF